MKFSIIMPVYNVEDYIEASILSVLNQTYSNFELLIGNDGSPDNSQKIIDKYRNKDNRIKSYLKKNTGPGDTRNFLISKAKGDYLVFLDSDDTLKTDFLKNANNILKKQKLDLLKVTYTTVKNGKELDKIVNPLFNNIAGAEAFCILVNKTIIVDSPSCFICNNKYWKNHDFKFSVGAFHEDFAIIPEVLIKSKNISSTNDCIFYYTVRNESTMNNKNHDFLLKKDGSMLTHYTKLKNMIDDLDIEIKYKDAFNYYIENSTISKLKELKGKDYEWYENELKSIGIYNFNANGNIKYILKKIMLNISTKLYLKVVIK